MPILIPPPGPSDTPEFSGALLSAATDPTSLPAETAALNERLLRQVWTQGAFHSIVPSSTTFGSATNGAGSNAFLNFANTRLISGTDAAGLGRMFSYDGMGGLLARPGDLRGRINFAVPFWLEFRFSAGVSAVGGGNLTTLSAAAWAQILLKAGASAGALASHGFGILIENASNTEASVKILTYDGSLHTSSPVAQIDFQGGDGTAVLHTATFYNTGTGTLHYWIDNVYIGSVATAPSGPAGNTCFFTAEVNNDGGTDSSELMVHEFRIGQKKN